MSIFTYRDGMLHAEQVSLAAIAEEVGTPFYCYATEAIAGAYRAFETALADLDPMICYAVKANGNLAVIRTLGALGAGADVVSEGEMRRALAAGIPPERIVFAGVGKTRDEMAAALDIGIHQFNVESEPELQALNEVSAAKGVQAPIALRINPDVDALTHAKISTGKSENKFGIDWRDAARLYALAAELPGLAPRGIAVHIGSQLTDLSPFRAAFTRCAELVRALRAEGLAVDALDFGGGLGIVYDGETDPDLQAYARIVHETAAGLNVRHVFEPGRMLVGNAGVLVARVIYVKEGTTRRFVIVDAAMNDLIRPTLYDAYHDIVTVRQPGPDAETLRADVVGPICESGDTFAVNRALAPVAAGDLLAFRSAGAYAAVMASNYNARLMAPEVLVKGDSFAVARIRQDYDRLMADERMPSWLT